MIITSVLHPHVSVQVAAPFELTNPVENTYAEPAVSASF